MAVSLRQLLDGESFRDSPGVSWDMQVSGICMDTRQCSGENVFIALGGGKYPLAHILKEAAACSAIQVVLVDHAAFISESVQAANGQHIIAVDDLAKNLYRLIDRVYGLSRDTMQLIGITGTNGKTTTAYFLFQLLSALQIKTSCYGTVRYWIDPQTSHKASLTTPDALTMRRLLHQAAERGVTVAVMEVSSHALDQKRIQGLAFRYAVFTNISQDHLDYHSTLAHYFDTKSRLFTHYLDPEAVSVINSDDSRGSVLLRMLEGRTVSYGIDGQAEVRLQSVAYGRDRTAFSVATPEGVTSFECGFFGKHNMYNVLAALSVLRAMGISLASLQPILPSLKLPPGRMEQIHPDIFVDYAHTPDALEQSLHSLKHAGYGKIIVVFGCGGERDKKKRPLMGMIATEIASFTIITTDNPRSEDPACICAEIEQGCLPRKHHLIIADRRQAISEALQLKQQHPDAAVLIAGKGHEDYQILPSGTIPFSDAEEVRKLCIK